MIGRIINLLKEKGITAYQLTTDLNLSNSAVTDWKKGKGKPSTDAVIKIAKYFNVSTDYLLLGEENNLKNEKENGKMDNSSTSKYDENSLFQELPTKEKFRVLRLEQDLTIDQVIKTLKIKQRDYSAWFETHNFNHVDISAFNDEDKKAMVEFFQYEDLFNLNIYDLPKPRKTDIGLRIKKQRKEAGLTTFKLAEEIDVDEISVISWESGERIPNSICLQKLNGILVLGDDMMKKYDTELPRSYREDIANA